MRTVHFEVTLENDGVSLRANRKKGLLGGTAVVPFADWADAGVDPLALAFLEARLEEGTSHLGDDGRDVLLSFADTAALAEPQGRALDLPPVTTAQMAFDVVGRIVDDDFKIVVNWRDRGQHLKARARRHGPFLDVDGQRRRLPLLFLEILDDVVAINAANDRNERLAALATLFGRLQDDGDAPIDLDTLRRIRVVHATRFSLDIRGGKDNPSFDPVLFGRDVKAADEDGATLSESWSLLPKKLADTFARERFRRFDDVRAQYAVSDGLYVHLEPRLRRALSVVRRLQDADRATRLNFVQNPQLHLKDALAAELDADEIDAIVEDVFVETEEYSQRVVGIGIWAPPILPWLARRANDWLPERFAVEFAGKTVVLTPDDVPALTSKVQEAIASGAAEASWNDTAIPATEQTLATLQQITGQEKPKDKDGAGGKSSKDKKDKPDTYAAQIHDNLEDVEYRRTPKRRTLQENTPSLPSRVATTPKKHQREGLEWLQACWHEGYPGALLADDMGLGKTWQSLAFMAWLRQIYQKKPILVVAPTGLLKNWEDEHGTHLTDGGLGRPFKAYGGGLKPLRSPGGKDVEQGNATLDLEPLKNARWVLTTYETLRDFHLSFGLIDFCCVVFDEIQKAKNPASMIWRGAATAKAEFSLGLTGTPIENRLEDLWSIVEILWPGRLGELKSFSKEYQPDNHPALEKLHDELLTRQDGQLPLILRRLKDDELEGLPAKHIHPIRREMPREQADAYRAAVDQGRSGQPMLATLSALRGISLTPFWPEHAITDVDAFIARSARMQICFEVLDQIHMKGERALLFLESLELHDVLAGIIKDRYGLPHLPLRISGKIRGDHRKAMVDRFQSGVGFDVMILSPKAGGVGLTATAANHVIHLSRWWNPAVEDQCTDRIYRIGQQRAVHVHIPLAVHPDFGDQSFDLLLDVLLTDKRHLSRRILIPPVTDADPRYFEAGIYGKDHAGAEDLLARIDTGGPDMLEHWVIDRLKAAGLQASKTPPSGDAGIDCIGVHPKTGRRIAVQCKHRCKGRAVSCNERAVQDLLRGRNAYTNDFDRLVAVTNAREFTTTAQRLAADAGIELIDRSRIQAWNPSL